MSDGVFLCQISSRVPLQQRREAVDQSPGSVVKAWVLQMKALDVVVPLLHRNCSS